MRRCLRCGAVLPKPGALTIETLARPAAPYASGDRVVGRYRILEAHGSGPLGTTYRAHDPTGRTMAVKVLPPALFPGDTERREFVERYGALCGRTLPGAALPLEVGVDNEVVFVASTWVYGASLRSIVRAYRAADRRLERDQVLGVLRGVYEGLRSLHAMTTHGAVYPENVSVTSDAVVLLDPGLAAALPPRRFVERVERAPEVWPYIAPELRVGKRANAGADLFALGALASELLTGDPARSSSPDFTAADLGTALEGAMRAAVSAQASRRVSADRGRSVAAALRAAAVAVGDGRRSHPPGDIAGPRGRPSDAAAVTPARAQGRLSDRRAESASVEDSSPSEHLRLV